MKKLLSHLFRRKTKSWPRRLMPWVMSFGLLIAIYYLVDTQVYDGELARDFFNIFENAYANGETGNELLSSLGQGTGNIIAGLASLFIKLLSGILFLVLFWMGDLMDNTFILEGDIGEKLRSVWIIIRNFVNIFFALALVIVALLSVIGYGDESGNYSMKKFIPKMALALIAVNFTFLACRIVLDVNNVLTTAIFSIPQSVTTLSDIGPSGTAGIKIFRKFKCFDSKEKFGPAQERMKRIEANPKYKNVINQLGGICYATTPEGVDKVTEKTADGQEAIALNASQFNKKDFVWAMATQFQGLHDLNKVSQLTEKSFSSLTVNALFSILLAIIYGTAYVVMFIILVARIAVLWFTIILSPLVAVSIAIPDLMPEELNIQKIFLNHAFIPVKMAIPLSFGYILISQMVLSVETESYLIGSEKSIDLTGGEFARGATITSMMYGAMSVAVVWMGVFMASKGVVGEKLVTTIKDKMESAGRSVARWPTYLPIIPTHGGVSPAAVMAGLSEAKHAMAERFDRETRAKGREIFGVTAPAVVESMREFGNKVERGLVDASHLRTIAEKGTAQQFRQALIDAVKHEKMKKGTVGSRKLASLAGVSESQLRLAVENKDTAALDRFQSTIRASSVSGGDKTGPAGPELGNRDISALKNVEIKSFAQVKEDKRSSISMSKEGKINIQNISDYNNVITGITDKGFDTTAFKDIVEKVVAPLAADEKKGGNIRASLVANPAFTKKFKELVGTEDVSDQSLVDLYAELTVKKGDKIDEVLIRSKLNMKPKE